MAEELDKWRNLVDKQIAEMFEKTDPTTLPGVGKRLNLGDDSMIPSDQRMAMKIMKDHDVLPDWLMRHRDLDREQKQLQERLEKAARLYRGMVADARRTQNMQLEQQAETIWRRSQIAIREAYATYNKRVLSYNLQVPAGIKHRSFLDFDRDLVKFV